MKQQAIIHQLNPLLGEEKTQLFAETLLVKARRKDRSPKMFLECKLDESHSALLKPHVSVLEQILALVVYTYYDKDFQLPKVVRNIEAQTKKRERKSKIKKSGATRKSLCSHQMLSFLLSPLKIDAEIEKWSLKQIALFESSICLFGKRFELIVRVIRDKTLTEIIQFYNVWKFSSHYRTWKYYQRN